MTIGQAPGSGSASQAEKKVRSRVDIKQEIETKQTEWENADNRLNNDPSMNYDAKKRLAERVTNLLFDIDELKKELRNAK